MTTEVILGIDEVGRGPWSGPLVVGAVILGTDFANRAGTETFATLADSKKLTPKKREHLNPLILAHAEATGLGWISAAEIDQYGLSPALKLATRRAVKQVLATKTVFSSIIIDGTINLLQGTPLENRVTLLKKADSLIKEVSAASIIAKVARDTYMVELAQKYPGYGFENHVGYGTSEHKQALEQLGPCPEHRQSFRPIREIIARNSQNSRPEGQSYQPESPKSPKTRQNCPNSALRAHSSADFRIQPSSTAIGQTAELAVASYLQRENHQIIAHNFKTKTYEIDLISVKNQSIYFTEVKYSAKTKENTTPLQRITPAKLRQMRFAADSFLAQNPKFSHLEPILAVSAVEGHNYRVKTWFALES